MIRLIFSIIFSIIFVINAGAHAESNYQVRLFVPAFDGPKYIGKHVANVLGLQVLKTFRKSDPKRPIHSNFGTGVMLWDPKALPGLNYNVAINRAIWLDTTAHLVLWGRAYQYGDGVATVCYLSLTPLAHKRKFSPEEWQIDISNAPEKISLSVSLPSRHYEFTPIILKNDLLEKYQNIDRINVYSDRQFNSSIGFLGKAFTAIRWEQNAVLVKSHDISAPGWVPLPMLSEMTSEVVNFVASIVRLMRSDWYGARELLLKVLQDKSLPRTIHINATLMLGLIEEKNGRSGLKQFRIAYEMNTLRRSSVEYFLMGLFAEIFRQSKNGMAEKVSKDYCQKIRKVINDNFYLFGKEDPWIIQALKGVDYLEKLSH